VIVKLLACPKEAIGAISATRIDNFSFIIFII
jgi:hypothetical protein